MKKLYEVLGLKPIKADVGIEIECEGENIQTILSGFWKMEDDGSLRGEYPHQRAEFVLKRPIAAEKVGAALDNLIGQQKEARFNFSYRTSVHVHVNCLEMTADQILTFAYSYLIFEAPLLEFCGEGRKGNRFCLRLRDAENQLNPLDWLIKHGMDAVYMIGADQYRYAAMNMAALPKYGSIEFRPMRGNMDKAVLTTWVSALLELRAFSLRYKNPKELYDALANEGSDALLNKAFPTTGPALRFFDMERSINESVSLSIEIPFEWEKNSKKEVKKVAKFTFDEAVAQAEAIRGMQPGLVGINPAPVGGWVAAPRAPIVRMPRLRIDPEPAPELEQNPEEDEQGF